MKLISTAIRLTLLAGVLASGSAGAVNLVTNGSFEGPDLVPAYTYALYGGGSTSIPGWTVSGSGPVQVTPDTFMALKASDGHQWVDLTGIFGYDKGLVSDVIVVNPGALYHLSLDVGTYLPAGAATVGVTVNGGALHVFSNTSLASGAAGPMSWASFGFDWTAESSLARIEIYGLPNGAFSNDSVIGVDNVTFAQAVPEPETYALMLAGLGVMGFLSRRRRN